MQTGILNLFWKTEVLLTKEEKTDVRQNKIPTPTNNNEALLQHFQTKYVNYKETEIEYSS